MRRPELAPGGWAFEFDNDIYPDIDDTAEVVLALRRARSPAGPRGDAARTSAIERGVRWMAGMQSRDGGWGAFDADNTSTLVTKLPFCDFGAVIDPPSADVTAHVVEALAAEGLAGSRAARRGVVWLLRAQESDGSWFGRWGANYVYGTGAVVPALIAAGVKPGKPAIRRAVAWLEEHQNADGGWGEDMRSYDDPALAGRGESTASQTAWALLALLAAGERRTAQAAAVERGVRWLAEHQREDGDLGRAAVHRHRVPAGLLHQLPPVPAGVPGERARPIPGRDVMTAQSAGADGFPEVPPRAEPEAASVASARRPDVAAVRAGEGPDVAAAGVGGDRRSCVRREAQMRLASGLIPSLTPGWWCVRRCCRRPGRCGRGSATAARSGLAGTGPGARGGRRGGSGRIRSARSRSRVRAAG